LFATNFFSEDKSFVLQNKKSIRKLLELVCEGENKKISFINCIFCSDKYLLEINKKHLKHNQLTDVITFDYAPKNDSLEGDVYISVDTVRVNAKDYNVSFQEEVVRVIVHGVLHLVGFLDKSKKEKRIMRSKENKYLSLYKDLKVPRGT
jgi:probable rRNA maturation factor|tara:strand:- start:4563 stop:5009 length:447 start_codon:yes stop_codon:yes gene_type:complete